jgi:hypothetical protein
MCRIALDDPCLDGVGKNAAEKTNGARGRSSAASEDSLTSAGNRSIHRAHRQTANGSFLSNWNADPFRTTLGCDNVVTM